MQKIAIYPGSFDPITKGHIDIIKRSAKLVDTLIVGVLDNASKSYWFNNNERKEMAEKALIGIDNIKVVSFNGLLADFMQQNNINLVIRGLRSVSDYEYELQLALTNRKFAEFDLETIFIPASQDYQYMSSSIVREVAINKGKLNMFVPECLIETIEQRVEENLNKTL
jgi:pantetheine-phosphate adenylyltransferase